MSHSRQGLWLLALFGLACSGGSEPSERQQPSRPAATQPAEPEARPQTPPPSSPGADEQPQMVRRMRNIMHTQFQIVVVSMPEEQAAPLIGRAFDEIERLETVLSEWLPESEISQVNASAGGSHPISIGPDVRAVIEAGLSVSTWSEGAFDLSWAALRGLYAFRPGENRVPPIATVRQRLRSVNFRWIDFDRERSTLRLERASMAIGTGGIAKGYALDRAGAILRAGGAASYMLFGGGQVQVHGMRGNRPWRVGIQHPRNPEQYIGFLEASEGSISTSGDYVHAFRDSDGTHWHHIIDLETGLPARRSMQVTLLAPEGIYADALSTAAFILGPERAMEMLSAVPGHPEAVIIGPDLRLWTTPGTRERLVMRVELDEERIPGEPEFRERHPPLDSSSQTPGLVSRPQGD